MSRAASAASTVARIALAVATALSWLLVAGPASAFVTRATVESPKAGAVLRQAKDLIVAVERAGPEETVRVRTRLLYGGTPAAPNPEPTPTEGSDTAAEDDAAQQQQPAGPEPVSDKIIRLAFIEAVENEGGPGQVMRFGGVIDPYRLEWLPEPGVAANGQYTLEYQARGSNDLEWQRYEFRIDAPPPATSAPGIAVTDAEAKRLSIAWQAHPVPDLSHYVVERSHNGGDWVVAAAQVEPSETQIDDTVSKYGSYRYRVTAVRPAGDGSDEVRTAVSPGSEPVTLAAADEGDTTTGDSGNGNDGDDPGTGSGTRPGGDDTSSGNGTAVPPPLPSTGSSTNPGLSSQTVDTPQMSPPRGFQDTYKGPLDYGVEQKEVTERVPVDVAQGGAGSDSTLKVLDRAVDQSRVLPPVAGGLILVVSAAHVLRYLNE